MKKVWQKHIVEFVVLIIFLILYVCTEIIMAFLFGEIIDTANTSNLVEMKSVIIFTIVLLVVHPIIYWIYNVLKKRFVYGMSKDVKVLTFSSLME